jgi:hypothetical protein
VIEKNYNDRNDLDKKVRNYQATSNTNERFSQSKVDVFDRLKRPKTKDSLCKEQQDNLNLGLDDIIENKNNA